MVHLVVEIGVPYGHVRLPLVRAEYLQHELHVLPGGVGAILLEILHVPRPGDVDRSHPFGPEYRELTENQIVIEADFVAELQAAAVPAVGHLHGHGMVAIRDQQPSGNKIPVPALLRLPAFIERQLEARPVEPDVQHRLDQLSGLGDVVHGGPVGRELYDFRIIVRI